MKKVNQQKNYYRYFCGRKSVFEVVSKWFDSQTKKRYGKEWAEESRKLTDEINKAISWLQEREFDKSIKYYFTEIGRKKYEKTLLNIHKRILLKRKISKRKFKFFIRDINGKTIIYNKKNNKKIGRLFHEDKYQIGVKIWN